MSDPFYRAFEDRFRGSRTLIKERLKAYSPFLTHLTESFPGAKAVDLGCGRGEWLEFLKESGFSAQGIDLDEDMLAACTEMGLDARKGDAIKFLKGLPAKTYALVSAFHLVEHISFSQLRELVSESHRVLMPGGLLIMETPNPENLVVGSNSFYLDPTHQRPIPPALLNFIPEYVGFNRTRILRLQETFDISGDVAPSLIEVLGGVSPDYAVIAQKDGEFAVLDVFNEIFERSFGFDLGVIADQYEQGSNARLNQAESKVALAESRVEARLNQAESRVEQAESKVALAESRVEARLNQAESRVEQAESKVALADSRVEQAESRVEQAESLAQQAIAKATESEATARSLSEQLNRVYQSRSWRITAPLRKVVSFIKRLIS